MKDGYTTLIMCRQSYDPRAGDLIKLKGVAQQSGCSVILAYTRRGDHLIIQQPINPHGSYEASQLSGKTLLQPQKVR
jgi:hypothetical protein